MIIATKRLIAVFVSVLAAVTGVWLVIWAGRRNGNEASYEDS